MHVMERVEETLGVRLETDIAAMQLALGFNVLQIESTFTVGQGRVTLHEKRVGGVTHDIVVGILTTLGSDHPCGELLVRSPKFEVSPDITRVTDLLECYDIRPEGVDKALLILLKSFTQLKTHIEEQLLFVLLLAITEITWIIESLENIVRHGLNFQTGLWVGFRNPLHDTLETCLVQHIFGKLQTLIRACHGERWQMFVIFEETTEIVHDHGKAGVVMPFLLGLHQLQRETRMDIV